MEQHERRKAIAAFKERKPAWGVYAVISTSTGEAWVGCSRSLDAQKNRIWFELEWGRSPHPTLQAAWNHCAGDGFRFEELERLREDFPEFARDGELRQRQSLWRTRLHAAAV